MPGSGLEFGELIVWAVAGRGLKGVSVKYWLNGSLSTVTITVWRYWYTRVTQLTGFGLRSICTPPGSWSALTFSSGVIADWALWAWHVRFLYYFRRKLNLGEHRGHCLVTALSLIRQEQAKDIQNYVILCVLWYPLCVATPAISGEYPSLLGYYAASTGKLLPMYLRSVVPPSWCCSVGTALLRNVGITSRHGVISQETWTCIIAAMGTSSRNTRWAVYVTELLAWLVSLLHHLLYLC